MANTANIPTTIVIIHKEQIINPAGINGGAEMASLALARTISKQGALVYFAGNLAPEFVATLGAQGFSAADNLHYLNLGPSYDTVRAFYDLEEVYKINDYHLIVMCCAQSLLESRYNNKIKTRIFVDHEPSCNGFGVSPAVIACIADHIVAVSSVQKEQLVQSHCPADKIAVIPNGVNLEVFQPGETANRDFNKLVFAGALVIDKGVHLLIESYSILKQKYPQLTLDIYGSAKMWSRNDYFNLEHAKALPGLTFRGAVDQQTLAQAFQRAGLAILPSIYFDSFNMSCAEAQATGLPVIGSYHTGMRDIIIDGQSGVLLKTINRDTLTAAIETLLSRPQTLAQMSSNAQSQVRPKFNWQLTAQQFSKLLEQ